MHLNYLAPCNHSGYGVVGFNLLKTLVKQGHEVAYFPLGGEPLIPDGQLSMVQACIDNRYFYDPQAPSLRLFHQDDLAEHIGKGLHVGFPIFELDTFSEKERHQLQAMDRILVCSDWAKGVVEKSFASNRPRKANPSEIDVRVVPLGVDQNLFRPTHTQKTEKTVFLNVGKWEMRKGHDILIKAFNQAFTERDNVELWLLNHHELKTSHLESLEWQKRYQNAKLGKKVKFYEPFNHHKGVALLMQCADCGVFPARAEGWNLPVLEMMSCGKPVIVTDYSGHTAFCHQKNARLIPVEATEPALAHSWFQGQGNWARLKKEQIDALIEHMRAIHQQKMETGDLINQAGIQTARQLSWEHSANQLLEALR